MLVPPAEPEAVAAAVLDVLTAPERAAGLALAARRRIEREFTLAAMVAKTTRVYETSLAGKLESDA
jgi:glycosyltransferase involved in cell wall biosynthesis